jgi:hypothetical protein
MLSFCGVGTSFFYEDSRGQVPQKSNRGLIMKETLYLTAADIIQIQNLISIAERVAKETPDADYAGWIKKQIRCSRKMLNLETAIITAASWIREIPDRCQGGTGLTRLAKPISSSGLGPISEIVRSAYILVPYQTSHLIGPG